MPARRIALVFVVFLGFVTRGHAASTCPVPTSLSNIAGLQIHGFLTQGFVKTDHNRFFGPSDKGSFEFREIGLNASYRPLPSLLLTAQGLSRRAGNMYNGSPTIDFALARWELSETDDHQATLSIGRHKNPIGLYNATRDVAHTRPSVFVPQSVYFDRVRNLLLSSDGVMLHLDHYADFGELSLDAGVGKPVLDKNVEVMLLGRDWPGDLSSGRPARLGRIHFTTPDQRWQAALSYADTQIAFDPAAGSIPGPGTTHIGYLVASLQFTQGNWTVTGEYMLEPASAKGFGAPFDNEVTGEGYYLQLQRYVGPSLSLHVRYEEAYLDRDDRNGRASALRTGLPASFFFAKSWTVGARWDVTSRLMLSADFSGNDGNYFLSSRDNPSPAALKRRWNMISILASYRF